MKLLVLASCERVIFLAIVVLLKVSLQPLAELKVVEILALGELGDVDMSLDSVLVEGVLEDLVVLYELVLVLGAPLDS